LVDLGGDMVATGPLPGADGSEQPWLIGIAAIPGTEQPIAARVPLYRGAIASSGDYERCLTVQGRRYGHILDPHSGWPVADGPSAVSVLAPTCLLAGTLATLALLQGPAAAEWLAANGVDHWLQWPTD
jgi:thiamine biosynthesis lipoprotein